MVGRHRSGCDQDLIYMKLDPSQQPTRPWTVYLIHHSHTDVGYTETQNRIEKRHGDFTDQALRIIADKSQMGFVWNNECHWALERWLQKASPAKREELAVAVRAGRFGLSGGYLHFTELLDEHTARQVLARAQSFGAGIGVLVDTAIHADINGFSWGYSQALHDSGVKNLLMFLHPHHGLAPLDKRQTPFWWETPNGDHVFVWLGEHYNVGNVMGLCPRGHLTHGMKDEWSPKNQVDDDGLISEFRLPRYLRQLENDGFTGSIVPMAISGMTSDNAPPNIDIARFAEDWNSRHGDNIRIEMTTASKFANLARGHFQDVPTYRGDWPDWWSDGFASQPDEVRICRQAQRDYTRARSIAKHQNFQIPTGHAERAEFNIALYTEHTFGHADSVLSPWDGAVKTVAGMKRRYAYQAAEAAEEVLDEVEVNCGALPLSTDRPFIFRVVNPTGQPLRDYVRLYLEGPDFSNREMDCVVLDIAKGLVLPAQKMFAPRGMAWGVWLDLAPHENRDLEMKESLLTLSTTERNCTDFIYYNLTTLPDVTGIEGNSDLRVTAKSIESSHVQITWNEDGIISWLDRSSGRDLLDANRQHNAWTPVYERTPVLPTNSADAQCLSRGRIGRNRKGSNVERTAGKIVSATAVSAGPLFASVQIDYALSGCGIIRLFLTVWKNAPRVDIALQVHKDSVWDPENLFISLPFTTGEGDTLWIDKMGAAIRPGIDQLPGSCTDFYTMQAGFVLAGKKFGIAIAAPDAPLLQLGDLEHGQRLLMDAPGLANRPLRPYGWLLSNYWETNFEATVGGFHEFRYRMEWGAHLDTAEKALDCCRALNFTAQAFRAS